MTYILLTIFVIWAAATLTALLVPLKKDGWVYKVAAIPAKNDMPSENLCAFVWQLIFGVMIVIGCIVVAGFLSAATLVFATVTLFAIFTDHGYYLSSDTESLYDVLIQIGFAIWAIIIIVFMGYVIYSLKEAYKARRARNRKYVRAENGDFVEEKVRKPNLLMQKIRAGKEKICPKVEFE